MGAIVIATATAFSPRAPAARHEPPRTELAAATTPAPSRPDRAEVASPQSSTLSPEPPPVPSAGAQRTRAPAPSSSFRATRPAAQASATPAPAPSGVAAAGTVNVSARPKWALISVDGKTVGSTPVAVSGLAAGAHVIDAALLGDGPAQRKTVEVEPGKIVRVHFVFP